MSVTSGIESLFCSRVAFYIRVVGYFGVKIIIFSIAYFF